MTSQSSGATPATVRLWSLSEDTLVESDTQGVSLHVVAKGGEYTLAEPSELVRESLRRMTLGPVSLANVAASVRRPGTGSGVTDDDAEELMRVLDLLSASVVHSLGFADGLAPLLSAVPTTAAEGFEPRVPPRTRPLRLSRFAALRGAGQELVLDAPHAVYRIVLQQPLSARICTALAKPCSVAEMADELGHPEAVIAEIAAYLLASGCVLLGDEQGGFAEDDAAELRPWSHHDLRFHVFSRSGRHDAAESRGVAEQPPLFKPVPDGPRIALPRPQQIDADRDPRLGELLESASPCSGVSDLPLTADQLGELLYRSARVRSMGTIDLHERGSFRSSERPYFSVARLYELELYLVVAGCAGLAPGIYHYDPEAHAVVLIREESPDWAALLDMAKVSAGIGCRPPLLITATARLARSSWLLNGAAYATALMHVGALQQVLHLTAKAMGLSARPVPMDSDGVVARALRLPWPDEVDVGECVVGVPC
ncbi:SagB family peptide dehydrogenase [Saccharopolyspora indica]|uniref:SagB family peptide dehydrogenase n=1 Tax=Saccharopolyspora indica TaxID=1229659 RepID=UPI0022EA9237|nr:SagB family peptide dehydrogenase [Saccharopolyspora indica]MDA3646980.1 SagB family peptide dehydrogenase [Saccharopolyspora indica]